MSIIEDSLLSVETPAIPLAHSTTRNKAATRWHNLGTAALQGIIVTQHYITRATQDVIKPAIKTFLETCDTNPRIALVVATPALLGFLLVLAFFVISTLFLVVWAIITVSLNILFDTMAVILSLISKWLVVMLATLPLAAIVTGLLVGANTVSQFIISQMPGSRVAPSATETVRETDWKSVVEHMTNLGKNLGPGSARVLEGSMAALNNFYVTFKSGTENLHDTMAENICNDAPSHSVAETNGEGNSRTANNPFIPPLPLTPESSPKAVISTNTPNWNQRVPLGGGYALYSSAYSDPSAFSCLPNLSVMVRPGVIRGMFSPQQQVNGLSKDFIGYPGSGGVPPMLSSNRPFHSSAPASFAQMGNLPLPLMMNGSPWQGGVTGPYPPFYGGPDPGPWGQQTFGQQPQPFRAPLQPPSQIFDRMDPFLEGKDYGAVLDPFLIRVVGADVRLNPLISPLPEDGSNRIHLIWNMLFPTSTVQRSTDPSHIPWSKGRDAPATFPRISSLRLVSDTIPWVFNVEARDISLGVTCGEVIDSIGHQLLKFSDQHDYNQLTPSLRHEVDVAYRRNRSREGSQWGQGIRLDFLRQDTMFAGIEVNDRVVKRVCGDVFPCVFVLRCSKIFPMTRQEVEDREARLAANDSSSRPRSEASSDPRIIVQPPSTVGSDW